MKATEILAKSQAATASLIQKGTKGHKESIYKSEIFEGLSDKEKKSSRKKIRNLIQSMLSTICTAQEPALTKLITEFTDLYTQVYAVNDYSLASISSGNTSDETKAMLTQGLDIIKEFYTPNKPKDKAKAKAKK